MHDACDAGGEIGVGPLNGGVFLLLRGGAASACALSVVEDACFAIARDIGVFVFFG